MMEILICILKNSKKKNIFVMLVPHMYGNPSIKEIKKLCSKKKYF